jgi:hypothetical protein
VAKPSLDDIGLVPQACHSFAQLIPKMREISTGHVLELNALQVGPDSFLRVQLRRVSRQPLKQDAFSGTVGQKGLHLVSAVDGRPVPHDGVVCLRYAATGASESERHLVL